MEMPRLARLLSSINEALRDSDHARALRLILSNFGNVRDSAPLRERVALILAEKGRKKEAVAVFELVGRHYANAGYPTRAIAAAKQLESLKPDSTNLLDHIATLYNIRSPFLSSSVDRLSMDEPGRVDLSGSEPRLGVDDLLDLAAERALERKGLSAQPDRLPALPLLSLLPQDTFRNVLDHLEYELFDGVQPVLEKGERVEDLVWTASDDLMLEEGDQGYLLPRGALIGLSSFGPSGRAAEVDVLTQSGSEVLKLSGERIRQIAADIADFPNRLSALRRHSMTERLIERHEMFRDLTDEQRVEVIEAFTGMRITAGEVVIRQNTASPGLFIILDGEVDVVRQDDDWEITIATLHSGDVFGEMGLVADKPAVAGCVMASAGHILHLPRDEFHALAERFPSVRAYTAQLADSRMSEAVLSADDLAEVE